MISIIICHVNPELLAQVKENIKQTIGVEYELIVMDNSDNKYNIFQAYNLGVKQSKYPFLCFVHEDVLFHTQDWGRNLIRHFEDKSIGLVGTIGGTAFPNCPAPWWNNENINQPHLNLIQHWKNLTPPAHWIKSYLDKDENILHQYNNPTNGSVVDAVAVDGVFFSIRKEFFDKGNLFDELTFDGFHCYDTDTCFQVLKAGYRVVIVYDILLEHFSLGTINKSWALSAEKLADKWKNELPLFAPCIKTVDKIDLYNHNALLTYCYWMKSGGFDDAAIRKVIKKYYYKTDPNSKLKVSMQLSLWKNLGYGNARIPFFILRRFYK